MAQDSGTGETKLLRFQRVGRNVETTVIATLPSLVDMFSTKVRKGGRTQ